MTKFLDFLIFLDFQRSGAKRSAVPGPNTFCTFSPGPVPGRPVVSLVVVQWCPVESSGVTSGAVVSLVVQWCQFCQKVSKTLSNPRGNVKNVIFRDFP